MGEDPVLCQKYLCQMTISNWAHKPLHSFWTLKEGGGVWAAEMEERERGGEGVRGERGGGGGSLAEQLILFSGSGSRLAAPVPN